MKTAAQFPNPVQTTEKLLEDEEKLFIKEYEENYAAGETKPRHIGMPYLLRAPQADTGVLLIHGLMAAPEEVREWAQFLHDQGLSVYAPRLAGHGTSSQDLSKRCYQDWLDSVGRGQAILQTCCKKILVAGFSTGAGLALQAVIQKPRDFEAVIAVSAPLRFKEFSSRFAEALNLINQLFIFGGLGFLAKEFMKNDPDNPQINYFLCPVSSFVQVKKLMKVVRRSLGSISIPALIIQANGDPKVAPQSGPAIFQRLGSAKKRLVWIDSDLHGIVRGPISRKVFQETQSFLAEHNLTD